MYKMPYRSTAITTVYTLNLYLPKSELPAAVGTAGKKNMPRRVALLFDGLVAAMHWVNLLQAQFMDLGKLWVVWKTFQEHKTGHSKNTGR